MDAKLSIVDALAAASSLRVLDSSSKSFPKTLRLRKRREYLQFLRAKTRYTGRFIIIEQRSNGDYGTRLGITVTRRYGKAHERNRFKRIVREAFREALPLLPTGMDLNVKPRSAAKEALSPSIYQELLFLLNG